MELDIVEFAEKILNVQLTEAQKEILRKLEEAEWVAFDMRRKVGEKTMQKAWDEYEQFKKIVGKFVARQGRML